VSNHNLLGAAEKSAPRMLELLKQCVEVESPSGDGGAIAEVAGLALSALAGLPVEIRRTDVTGGAVVEAVLGADKPGEPVLILVHLDTVYPRGTLESWPCRVSGDEVSGPGVFDMKGGLVQSLFALRLLTEQSVRLHRPVRLMLTPDEETGSKASRPLLERAALDSLGVLIPEPALGESGALKISRSGRAHYELRVRGIPSHAGLDPLGGASAIKELCLQVPPLYAAARPEAGCHVNVGLVRGGTAVNVVAEEAEAVIDVRLAQADQFAHVDAAMRGLEAFDRRCTLELSGGLERPAWSQHPDGGLLFGWAREIGAELGLPVSGGHAGGGSDGNFTAALGVPTLDGLGPIGSGAHARGMERIRFSSLVARTAFMAALIARMDEKARDILKAKGKA
jgi:glutamate carboxypeptidase